MIATVGESEKWADLTGNCVTFPWESWPNMGHIRTTLQHELPENTCFQEFSNYRVLTREEFLHVFTLSICTKVQLNLPLLTQDVAKNLWD